MRNKFFIYLIFIPLLSFSGCPDCNKNKCIDKYEIKFNYIVGLDEVSWGYYLAKEICEVPDFTVSLHMANSTPQPVLFVSQPINNPITGFCAKKSDIGAVHLLRVNNQDLNKVFYGIIQLLGFESPWSRFEIIGDEFCTILKFSQRRPRVEYIECDRIILTIPIEIQKSILDDRILKLEENCPC